MLLQEQNYKKKMAKKSQLQQERKQQAEQRTQEKSDYKDYKKTHAGYCVYHIAKEGADLSEGYIGVSWNFQARKAEHLKHLELGCHVNYKLQSAYNKGEIDESSFVIVEANISKRTAYDQEYYLRRYKGMGWNIQKGGQFNRKK